MARWVWWVGAVFRFVLIPMLGVAAVAWWVIGDQSEDGGVESIAELPTLQDHSAQVGAIGILILAIVVTDLLWTRPVSPRRYALAVLPPVLLGGIGPALAVRIITSRAVGANIGGGLAILFGPIFLIGLVLCAVAMLGLTVAAGS
jgi:hypothetical protein